MDLKKRILDSVGEIAKNSLLQLDQVWNEIHGPESSIKEGKLNQFLDYSKDFFKDLVESEERRKHELITEIESDIAESEILQKELKMKIDLDLSETAPLEILKEKLVDSLKDFRKMKEERIAKFKKLEKEEKQLCELLELEAPKGFFEFPSQEDVEEKETKIFQLLQEKCERDQIVLDAKTRIRSMMEMLEKEPRLNFEIDFFQGNFLITSSNMTKLKDWELVLKSEINIAKENKDLLLTKLTRLWDRINVEEQYRNEFLSINSGFGKSTTNNIVAELERCEAIKLANIKPMILSARKELEMMWELCTYTEEERETSFPAYKTNIFNEDILQLYELEIEALRQHYDQNMELYELAAKWEALWERVRHFEENAKDKTRLFNNRGGQLLKEEKERKALAKKLPTVYADMVARLDAYNEENLKPFKWRGKDLLRQINNEWEEWLQNENIKTNSLTRSTAKKNVRFLSKSTENLNSIGMKSMLSTSRSCSNLNAKNTPDAGSHLRNGKLFDVNTYATPKRTPLKRQNPPTAFSSSAKRPCTPKSEIPVRSRKATPLKAVTPNLRKGTPLSANKETPRTLRFTPARTNFNLNF